MAGFVADFVADFVAGLILENGAGEDGFMEKVVCAGIGAGAGILLTSACSSEESPEAGGTVGATYLYGAIFPAVLVVAGGGVDPAV